MRRSGARSFRMRWNRGDATTTGPGARRRIPVGAGGRARRTARRARTGRGKRGCTGPAAGPDGQGNGEGRRASMCRFRHGSPQGVRGAYTK